MKSFVQVDARVHAHAAGFYVALLHEGELELAHKFASWWYDRTKQEVQHVEHMRDYADPDRLQDEYSLDELGIDQEDREWP